MNKAFFVLPLAVLSLLAAILGGWLRIGWDLPLPASATQHGVLMVGSFLATLIFLERTIALDKPWLMLIPGINGLSFVFLLTGLAPAGHLLLLAGSLGFFLLCIHFIFRYKEPYYYGFLAGAACLVIGNGTLLQTGSFPAAVNWWMGFLLFTIVAERLELSRFLPLGSTKRVLLWICLALVLAGLIFPSGVGGQYLFATGVAAVAVWLLLFDMARQAVKVKGSHRYSALLLIIGYLWLLVTAVLAVLPATFVFSYDAVLHSFFIGFVFSMIFSHAPMILPAMIKKPVKLYRPLLYFWFALLQGSLLLRMEGDRTGMLEWRRWGGMLNGVVILLFFISIALILRGELAARRLRKA